MARRRLDELVVDRGLAADLREAASLLMEGAILVDGCPGAKPGTLVREDRVRLSARPGRKYVSRGGWKLEAALDAFRVDPRGQVCADLGCSTGGFTDCLLQRGALRVYAFDVGRGVMDWRLRQDPRVVLREGFNVRYLSPADIPEPLALVVADLSFISLRLIFPVLVRFVSSQHILLVKPQFEAGRREVEAGGLVTDPVVRGEILQRVKRAAVEHGLRILGEMESPLPGQKGNREYLLWTAP
ncbi:MAG: TlyA family rRNA (cytidine-2'-O)-methyltransferase [Acidobacteriota bacterium]